MRHAKKYKLKGKALQLTQRLGALGGAKNSEAQKLARQKNIYTALEARHPNSVKVKAKLKELKAAWTTHECANCGDVHDPEGDTCYCGCSDWKLGDRI